MGLILKIAAGVIIGSLFVQIISYKFIEYDHKKKWENTLLAQGLRNRSIILMNSVHSYYKKHKTLPKSLDNLDCAQYEKCAEEEKDSVFYMSYQDEWILIEPYLASENVKYHCRATLIDRGDPRFHHCIKIDNSEIPQYIRDSVSKDWEIRRNPMPTSDIIQR